MDEELKATNSSGVSLKNYEVKPLFQKRGIDIFIALVLTLISILGVSAVFWNELSLGYTVVFDVAMVLISAFVLKKDKKLSASFFSCGILSLICSWSFFITSNIGIKIILLFTTAASAIVWFTCASGKEYVPGDYNLIIYFFTTIFRAFNDLPRIFKSLFLKSENKSKTASNILIGIACAIPAVLIIVPLLSSADDAFGSLISGIFDDYYVLLQKVILGALVAVLLIALTFSLKYNNTPYSNHELKAKVNSTSISAFLCVVCFVYLAYLFSQLAYFFSAFSSILPKGYKFTYANYARRGFFELCIIAIINLLFIFAAILISQKVEGKLSVSIKLPSVFIVIFTFIIIITALSKMVMYINAYGCTVLRIFTSAFMIWLFLLFICVLTRILTPRFDFLKFGLISALIILSVLGIGNINARIAEYNYNAYISGKIKMDVKYMSDLGDEGIPYLYKLTKDKDTDVKDQAKRELSYKYENYYDLMGKNTEDIVSYKEFKKLEKTRNEIGKFSLPLSKAYKTLDKYAKEQDGEVFFGFDDIDDSYEYYDY